MTAIDEAPDHIPPMSEEGIWERLKLRFSLFCDLVTWMQVETREQAVGVSTETWTPMASRYGETSFRDGSMTSWE